MNARYGVTVHPQASPFVHALFQAMREQRISVVAMEARSGVGANTLLKWAAEPRCSVNLRFLLSCLEVVGLGLVLAPAAVTAFEQEPAA